MQCHANRAIPLVQLLVKIIDEIFYEGRDLVWK